LGYGPVPVIPLPHPSGVGRWLNAPANRALVERAMVQLKHLRQDICEPTVDPAAPVRCMAAWPTASQE